MTLCLNVTVSQRETTTPDFIPTIKQTSQDDLSLQKNFHFEGLKLKVVLDIQQDTQTETAHRHAATF